MVHQGAIRRWRGAVPRRRNHQRKSTVWRVASQWRHRDFRWLRLPRRRSRRRAIRRTDLPATIGPITSGGASPEVAGIALTWSVENAGAGGARLRTHSSAAENESCRTQIEQSRTARSWSLRRCATAEKLWCMPEPIRVIPPQAFVDSDPTAGVRRKLAIDVPGLWSGLVQPSRGRSQVGIITVTTRPASTSCPGRCGWSSERAAGPWSRPALCTSSMCRHVSSTVSPTPPTCRVRRSSLVPESGNRP